MITAIVRFKMPEGTTLEEATKLFESSAPNYRGLDGLVRKYYLFGEGASAGGAYLWETRAAADKVYTDDWKAMMKERYGMVPTVEYFESPVIVDNAADQVSAAAE
ncbi:MAG TPA: monooxygenase [Alphaproteobacteria bacterium]|nr:monooxygenase [Alphaproteobacteria bacterium]